MIPPAQPLDPNVDPTPQPLPPPPGGVGATTGSTTRPVAGSGTLSDTKTAKITVVTNEGAKVAFDGIESDQTGTRHSFTTRAIPAGTEIRVTVKADGTTMSVGVRAGEKATIDLRK
jgi:uncharacterized protein (TIGR03000 family)